MGSGQAMRSRPQGECGQTVFSEHGRTSVLLSSQQLTLPVLDLRKIKPASILALEGFTSSLLAEEQWKVDGFSGRECVLLDSFVST